MGKEYKKMNVLFLMIAYPDVTRNTNMYTDLTLEFVRQGYNVYVAAPTDAPTGLNSEGGISVLRIKTLPLFNTSFILKGLANLFLPYQYKRAISIYLKEVKFDIIITPTPPVTFVNVAAFLKRKHRSKTYLILRDIFPQNARDLGLIKNNLVYSYFRRKEKKLYKIADSIGCMSPRNIEYIMDHNSFISRNKLHLLPNWTSLTSIQTTNESMKQTLGLHGKFVAIFAGNFGIPQKIEFLIEVAESIKDDNNISFILIGEGTEKQKIQKLIGEKALDNVLVLDQLPRLEYLKLLSECDVGLVTLSEKFTIPNIPSRTLSYWSLKIPVLAAVDRNTDYGDLLDSCCGGLWSVTGDISAFVSNLYRFYDDKKLRSKMGENGYNLIVNQLNPEKIFKTIQNNILN